MRYRSCVWRQKNVLKSGRFRAAFFFRLQTLLSYRTSESSFFSIQGEGVRGGPGGPPGDPGGSPGGAGGGRGCPGRRSGTGGLPGTPGGPPRGVPGGSPGGVAGGVPGGVLGGSKSDPKDEIKKRPLTCKNFVRRDFFSDGF
jgi:hypothetical protein